MGHKPFCYKSAAELIGHMSSINTVIPFDNDVSALMAHATIEGVGDATRLSNRIALQPMEGCDATHEGSPGELTLRRYSRYAKGGAGMIWLEATSVKQSGRANPRQLLINSGNMHDFEALNSMIKETGLSETGNAPYTVLQLTHSGRYSRPTRDPSPIVACRNKYLDKDGLDYTIITDSELDELCDSFADAAALAKKAGFDAVDVKCSHGYLLNELLAAYIREGRYGGSYENRVRLLLDVIDRINSEVKITVTCRLSAFDSVEYPYGWGCGDLSETQRLIHDLGSRGVSFINITAGNPYYNPHVNRPYDKGFYIPNNHQLVNEFNMLDTIRQLKACEPGMMFISSALSWFRHFGPNIAAGCIGAGWFDIAGFGRQGFAYPDFPLDLKKRGKLNPSKCCMSCNKCTELMRCGGTTGCVVRDTSVYTPLYIKATAGKLPMTDKRIAEHI